MKMLKTVACGACLLVLGSAMFAQTERSVEDDYLSNIQDVIITEMANSQDYDNKQVALQYLEESVRSGKVSQEQRVALQNLAGEGIVTRVRTNGRLVNNFPDIRAKACDLLGEIGSPEAQETLLTIAQEDSEPMVVSSAVRSLAKIGSDGNDQVVETIQFIQRKYSALNPTSSLSYEILDAYEKLAPTAPDRNSLIQSISEIASNYRFATPVRLKALNLIRSLQASNTGNN